MSPAAALPGAGYQPPPRLLTDGGQLVMRVFPESGGEPAGDELVPYWGRAHPVPGDGPEAAPLVLDSQRLRRTYVELHQKPVAHTDPSRPWPAGTCWAPGPIWPNTSAWCAC